MQSGQLYKILNRFSIPTCSRTLTLPKHSNTLHTKLSQLYIFEMYNTLFTSVFTTTVTVVELAAKILIGWQAYRGDQRHRKNRPT